MTNYKLVLDNVGLEYDLQNKVNHETTNLHTVEWLVRYAELVVKNTRVEEDWCGE